MNYVKKIIIVGGGSSGWSSAAYLSNTLPDCKIYVIDKEVSTPIGVGEATILSFKPFMDACGFDHWDWLNNLDTTPKAGILYPDWIKKGNTVWHPFTTIATVVNGMSQYSMWTHNTDLDFKRYAISSYDSAVTHNTVDSSYQAYHVDCIKFVNYVKDRIKDRITHLKSGVKNIKRDGTKILSLELENGQEISADLYVDCTGFANILTENPEKVDVYGRLFCNSAVSCHVEYEDRPNEIKPYTTAHATEIGWIWIIPTRSRIGSGLVYDKNFTTEEEAKACLENFWKDRKISKINKHKWDPYYKNKIWDSNVVSIGLSGGFIEPLESTGLALIHLGIIKLVDKIKHYYFSDQEIQRYNLEMHTAYEDAIDFVSSHYSYTEREEPFWQYVKENYKPSERLRSIIENHINSDFMNHNFLFEDLKVFSPNNYALWLEQLGYHKKHPMKLAPGFSKENIRDYLIDFADVVQANNHLKYPDAYTEVETYEKYWQSLFRPEVVR